MDGHATVSITNKFDNLILAYLLSNSHIYLLIFTSVLHETTQLDYISVLLQIYYPYTCLFLFRSLSNIRTVHIIHIFTTGNVHDKKN